MESKQKLKDRLILLAATGFGLGSLPFAPGTFGTLAALPLIGIMDMLPAAFTGFYLVCLVLVSVWIADEAEKILKQKDPGCIVIDEVAGFCVAVSLVPVSLPTLAGGFVLFRCFDIFKPGPVRYFEENYSGGAGVVLDDIMAGVMAGVILKLVYAIIV